MKSEVDGLLIIGYGNPIRGDDGAGAYAVRALRRRGFPGIETHQLTPELAGPLSRARLAVFIDADTTLAPGQVRVTPVAGAGEAPFEHHASPGAILRLTREVHGRAPDALRIGIGGESFELGEKLSHAARRAVRETLALVQRLTQTQLPKHHRNFDDGVGVDRHAVSPRRSE